MPTRNQTFVRRGRGCSVLEGCTHVMPVTFVGERAVYNSLLFHITLHLSPGPRLRGIDFLILVSFATPCWNVFVGCSDWKNLFQEASHYDILNTCANC